MKSPRQNIPNTGVSLSGSDAAPLFYFDNAYASGWLNGVVQIELSTNHLIPTEDNDRVRIKNVCAAHLRCNIMAAVQLRDMLDKAIAFAQQPPAPPN
jgi:hypothetical protein